MQEPTQDDWFFAANDAWDAGAHKKALSLFLKAAAAGETHALNSVGYFLDHGIGVKQDSAARARLVPQGRQGRRHRGLRQPGHLLPRRRQLPLGPFLVRARRGTDILDVFRTVVTSQRHTGLNHCGKQFLGKIKDAGFGVPATKCGFA